jgi:hypothetical protein
VTSLEQYQNQPATPARSQGTAVEQSRAVAEVAAAVRVAQDNPRDIPRAIAQMEQACRQSALANRAFYSLPRAGGRVEGSTVHLAREIGRCWTNIDYGIRELRRDDEAGVSEMQAWAWDQEGERPLHAVLHRASRAHGKEAAPEADRPRRHLQQQQ